MIDKKLLIAIIVIFSLVLGFAFGYVEGLPDGFNQGRSSYIEKPPENCYCIEAPKSDGLFVSLTLPNLSNNPKE